MTISAGYTPESYAGNDVATNFTINFPFWEEDEIEVVLRVDATGVDTTQTLYTHYTVNGGAQGSALADTGSIDMLTAPATGETLIIRRITDREQQIDLTRGGPLAPDSVEGGLDRAIMIAQESEEWDDRSLHYPSGETESAELPSSVDRASTYLGFDAQSEPIPLAAPTDTALTTPFSESLLDDSDAPTARATLVAQEDVITTRGDVVVGDSSGDADRLAIGAVGEYLRSDGVDPTWEPPDFKQNVLVNGRFDVWQRGTTFDSGTTPANSNDKWLMDRWLLLSDGNDRADVSREATVVPTGCLYSVKLDVETVGSPSEKFGICQIIEQLDAAPLIGQRVSLSFQARTTSGQVENIRAAILSWDDTADTVTSDVVSAWNAEGSNPTWAAHWTVENAPSNLALTNAFQTFKIENVYIDTANTTNIAVIIWVDDTDLVATDVLYIADVQLVVGASIGNPLHRSFSEELARCCRFYQKTFDYGTTPADGAGENGAIYVGATSNAANTNRYTWFFPVKMHHVPDTVTTYNPGAGTAGEWNITVGGPGDSTATVNVKGEGAVGIDSQDAMLNKVISLHVTVEAEL